MPSTARKGDWSPAALEVFHARLLKPGESSPEQLLSRVAAAIYPGEPCPSCNDTRMAPYTPVPAWSRGDVAYHTCGTCLGKERGGKDVSRREHLLESMRARRFLPNSPVLSNLGYPGAPGGIHACYVLPLEDTLESIGEAVKVAMLVHQAGGGTGYCLSALRPRGSLVGSTAGVASGPCSFTDLLDTATGVIKQGSQRRGANMGTFSCYHPDVQEFVETKARDRGRWTNFNVSVLVDAAFWYAVDEDWYLCLRFPTPTEQKITPAEHCYKQGGVHIKARELLRSICQRAWESGDPGMLFIDRANERNPHPELYTLTATNPCGEQWLGPGESCVLGSINLAEYAADKRCPCEGYDCNIDWGRLMEDIPLYVRTLDRLIDLARYPAPFIEKATKRTRRIGLGVMGWADLLLKLGIRYGSEESLELAQELGSFIREEAVQASRDLADELGCYPACTHVVPQARPCQRNAAVTTVAPTGTLMTLANCSGGIEPNFAWQMVRRGKLDKADPDAVTELFIPHPLAQPYLERGEELPPYFITAHEVTVEEHIRMQGVWQRAFSDNAISKTVNLPHSSSVEDVMAAYRMAWDEGCLGITIYRDGSREGQVLSERCGEEGCSIPLPERSEVPPQGVEETAA